MSEENKESDEGVCYKSLSSDDMEAQTEVLYQLIRKDAQERKVSSGDTVILMATVLGILVDEMKVDREKLVAVLRAVPGPGCNEEVYEQLKEHARA